MSAQDDVYGFTHLLLRGDGFLVARVSELGGVSSALAGLSIRASLTPGGAQLSLLRTTGGSLVVRRRAHANGAVTETIATALSATVWLRLERTGQTIALSQSADGTQWSSIQSTTVDLQETAYLGLAVTSQRPDAMATASMSNVQLVSHSSLPSGWTNVDLGAVASQVQFSQSTWTIAQWSSGTPASDGVSFVYQRVTGDAEVSVRLASLAQASAVAGLMVRGTLEPGSPFLWLRTSVTGQRSVQRQLAEGLAPTTTTVGSGGMPAWLKIVRQGTLLSVYQSINGTTWALLTTEAVDLPASIYMGMAVARGTADSSVALLDNLRISAVSANELPSISLTSPSSATTVFEGDSFAISAIASDRDDRLEAVEFFVDSARVGVDTAAPYLASWIATGVGLHKVSALARDSDGAVVRTSPVAVAVLARQGYDEGGGAVPTAADPSNGTAPASPIDPSRDGNVPIGTPIPSPPTKATPTPTTSTPTTSTPTRSTPTTSTPTTSAPTTTWRLVFTPSPDHDRTVDRYTAEIYLVTGRLLVSGRDLGRPAIVGGECTVDLTSSIAVLPAGLYQIEVRAMDDTTDLRSSPAIFDFTR